MSNSKRVEWLDIGKFLAITIMIFGHVGLPKSIGHLIHIFHMPVFFIFSGMTFSIERNKRLKTYIILRAKGLLAPYFIFAGGGYALYRLIPSLQVKGNVITLAEFIKLLFTHNSTIPIFNGFGVIQWFFTGLFFASIFAWILIWICEQFKNEVFAKVFAVVILIVISAIIDAADVPNIIGIGSAVLGTAFFIIGNISRKYFILTDIGIQIVSKWYYFFLSGVILLFVWQTNGSTNMRTITYNNIVLYIIGALAGSLMVIGVAVFFEKYFSEHIFYKAILYEGKNTVIILSLNRVIQCLIAEKIYYSIIFPFVDGLVVEKYVFVLFVVAVELLIFLPVIYFVNRFIPFSVGRRRKNFV